MKVGDTFYSEKSELCKQYGEGKVIQRWGNVDRPMIKVVFTDDEGKEHLGIYTLQYHMEME